MEYRGNKIATTLHDEDGFVTIMPKPATFIDVEGEIFFNAKGNIVFKHEGFKETGPLGRKMKRNYGDRPVFLGTLCDAIQLWERHMNPDDYDRGEGHAETMMLHGCD